MLLLVLIVAMLLGVLGPKLFAPGQWEHRFKVGLGLDLSSGTQVTLRAQTLTGKAPSTDEMNAAVGVIESRVNGTGNSGAQVQPQGANLLVVTVPGKGSQQTIELVSSTALLMFRQVLLYEPYGATNTPVPARERLAQRHAVGVREPLGDGDPVRQFHQHGEDLGQDPPGGQCQRLAQRVRGRAPRHRAARPPPAPPPVPAPAPARVRPRPAARPGDPSLVHKDVLAKFNKLVCKPGDTQAWKAQVGYVTTTPYNNPDVQVVACGSAGQGQWGKFALDVAKVRGTEVTAASAGLSTTSNQWQVNLTLNGQGAAAFSALTSRLYNNYYAAGQSGDQNAAVLNQVAIALDGNVVSAPQIQGADPRR